MPAGEPPHFPLTHSTLSKSALFERLTQPKKTPLTTCASPSASEEESCTFQPTLNPKSLALARRNQLEPVSAFERLYQEAVRSLQLAKEPLSKDESYPFHPVISRAPAGELPTVPLFQRLEQILEERRKKKKALQERQVDSFRPAINPRSEAILSHSDRFKSQVVERLMDYRETQRHKQEVAQGLKEAVLRAECPFRPHINVSSQSELLPSDFLARQQELWKEACARAEELKVVSQSDTHVPAINPLSEMLTKEVRSGESLREKLLRLSQEPQLAKRAQLQKLEDELYKECSFRPAINAISKIVGREAVPHHCQCTPSLEHFDFRPKIDANSLHLAKLRPPPNPLKSRLRREQLRREKEFKELEQCTFKPHTEKPRPSSERSLLEVEGVQSFMRKCEDARRKKQDLQAHEDRLFRLEDQYRGGKTQVAEFKLSERTNAVKKLREQAEDEFRRVCTFRPAIR